MFSFLGLSRNAVERLRTDKHIYLPADGRINISGLHERQVDYVAWALGAELGAPRQAIR